MKTKIYSITTAALTILSFASCDESSWIPETEDGKGSLELSSLAIDIDDAEKVVTRASTDVHSFLISVTDKNGKDMGSWTYGDMPEILVLPTGNNYILNVESHKIKDAEFEKPYFVGSANFDIQTGKITKIGEVVASFASLKVSIRFSDDFKSVSDNNTKVTVKGNNGSQLVYSINETRAGYFALGEATTFAAHFEGNINGIATKEQTTFKDVKAGDHHILTYSIKTNPQIPDQSGNLGSDDDDIDIKVDYEQVGKDGNVSVEEDYTNPSDRPGTEDPQEPENPGNDNKDPNNPDDPELPKENKFIEYPKDSWLEENVSKYAKNFNTDTDQAYLIIQCLEGVAELNVEIKSDDPSFETELSEVGVATKFDLADTSESNQGILGFFGGLGFPTGDKVKNNKEQIEFNISNFIQFLDGFIGHQKFILKVKDNKGDVDSTEIVIIGIDN